MSGNASSSNTPRFQIFLSHAGEDKETIARPLYHRLRHHGLSVFLDVESFRLGDHSPNVMDHAMQTAPIGIFIMSPEFVAKHWTMRELLTFVSRYDRATEANETPPLLISVFYRLTTRECRDPAIFYKYGKLFLECGLFKRATDGVTSLEDVKHALNTAATLWSIENNCNADNSTRPEMRANRESFVEMVLDKILDHLQIARRDAVNERDTSADGEREQRDVYMASNNVPPNPPRLTLDYDTPTTCEGELKAAVLRESGSRIVAVLATGKGGVGKTCALRGLADEEDIQNTFGGGILYIQLGNDARTSDLIHGVANIVDRTGGMKLGREIKAANSVEEACDKASKWFESQKCLFLVDDIWEINGIDSNVLSALGLIVHANSRMVYTTRDVHFLSRANKVIEFKEKEPFSELSQQMLMKHAGFAKDNVLDGKNMKAFKYFLTLCQGLPLGFGIVGSSVWSYSRYCVNKQDAWSEFHKHILSKRKDLVDTEAGEYGKLPKIVDLSLEVLQKRNVNGKFEQWFRALCVVEKQQSVPAQMLQKLWSLNTLEESETVVEWFAGVSVVQMIRKDGFVFVKLHDLILDIASRNAAQQNETQTYFRTLLHNYVSCGRRKEVTHTMIPVPETANLVEEQVEVGAIEQTTARLTLYHAWWEAEDDGYIQNNVCRILRHAGYVDELLWLLSQPQWVVQRLLKDGFYNIAQDLEHGKSVCNIIVCQHADRIEHLEMIGRAARLSTRFVKNNRRKEEGWFQMHGRLLWHATQSELTSEFVKKMEREAPRPWVKASAGLLEQASGGALAVVHGPGLVLCMREEEDEIWILWHVNRVRLHVGRYDRTLNHYKQEQLERKEHIYVECALLSSDGRSVVAAHSDGRIGVWNRGTGALERFVEHNCENHWQFVAFYAEGTRIACETRDHSIRLFDTLSGTPVGQPLEGHTHWVKCLVVSADGTRIVSGSADKTLRVWDAHSGHAVGPPLEGHTSTVSCVAFIADGTRIVSGSVDSTVRVWDARSGHAVGQPLEGHRNRVTCVAVSADGTRIVSGSLDRTVRVWDARSGHAVGQPLEGHTNQVDCVAVSADGTRIASGSLDKTVRVWDAHSGHAVGQPLEGHTRIVKCVVVSADGTRIVAGSEDNTVRVWDAHSGHAVGAPLEGHTSTVSCVAVSADGTRILSGSEDLTVRVWDAHSGHAVGQPLNGHTGMVMCVAVCADGTRIVSGSSDKTVRVWDAHSGHAVGPPIKGHTHWVSCVAVSADGTRIVSGSVDSTVRVWDARSGHAVGQPLKGHTNRVTCAAVSADGTRIVSGSFDNTVRVWDARSGRAVGQPLQCVASAVAVAVSADGTCIGCDDGRERELWAWDGGAEAWHRVPRDAVGQQKCASLALTWSFSALWFPQSAEVSDRTVNGSRVVLGTCEAPVQNLNGGDVFFDRYFRSSCRITR